VVVGVGVWVGVGVVVGVGVGVGGWVGGLTDLESKGSPQTASPEPTSIILTPFRQSIGSVPRPQNSTVAGGSHQHRHRSAGGPAGASYPHRAAPAGPPPP